MQPPPLKLEVQVRYRTPCLWTAVLIWLRPRNLPPPPAFGLVLRGRTLVSKDRRHLFVNPCMPLKRLVYGQVR